VGLIGGVDIFAGPHFPPPLNIGSPPSLPQFCTHYENLLLELLAIGQWVMAGHHRHPPPPNPGEQTTPATCYSMTDVHIHGVKTAGDMQIMP